MPHFLTRYVLTPLMPAALIAAPLASVWAANGGLSWNAACAGLTAVIYIAWAGASWREDRRRLVHTELNDPCFGSLERRAGGLWWGSVVLENQPGLLPISIAAGPKGPSDEQRERFQVLRDAIGDLDGPLRASLAREVRASQDASKAQLISVELTAEGESPAFVTTWSVNSQDGPSDVYNIPLCSQSLDTTSPCGPACEQPDVRAAG